MEVRARGLEVRVFGAPKQGLMQLSVLSSGVPPSRSALEAIKGRAADEGTLTQTPGTDLTICHRMREGES